MRMLLKLWLNTENHDKPYYLSAKKRKLIDEILTKIAPPDTIPRIPRSLAEILFWKVYELRNFLLYYGPIVLKNLLPSKFYNNFLLLSYATNILLSSELKNKKPP